MLAVRPPAYFPDFGFAALLVAAGRVVLADTFAFSRQSPHHRARIATSQGPMWLTVPCRHTGTMPTGQARAGAPALRHVPVAADEPWARRHRRALHAAYASAPFYPYHADALDALLLGANWTYLADLTSATTVWLARALGVPEPVRASTLPGAPASLAAVVAAATADAAYRQPDGPLLTLPDAAPRDAAVLGPARVQVLRVREAPRRQVFPGFVPGTSALDLVMSYGPAAAERLREAVAVVPFVVASGDDEWDDADDGAEPGSGARAGTGGA